MVAHRFTEDPRCILYQLRLLQLQSNEVANIVMPTVRRSVWYAHSCESIIQTHMNEKKKKKCSENVEKRVDCISLIVKIKALAIKTSN